MVYRTLEDWKDPLDVCTYNIGLTTLELPRHHWRRPRPGYLVRVWASQPSASAVARRANAVSGANSSNPWGAPG